MTATVCFTLIPSCPQCLQCIKSILNATTHKCVPAPNKSRHQLAHLFNGALHLTWTVRQIAICFTHALYHPGEGISQRRIVLSFFFLMHFLLTLGTRCHILYHYPPPKLNLCVSLCHWLQVPYCSHFQTAFYPAWQLHTGTKTSHLYFQFSASQL